MGATDPGQVIKVFAERFEAGDLDGLMELYEDDCLVPGPEGEIRGKDAIRAWLKGFLDSGAKLDFGKAVVLQAGDIALTHNAWTMEGGEPPEGATAEVLRKQADGTWRFVVDNPFGTAVLEM